MKYKVILHYTEEGISVSVPGLPGCWSEGDTEKEALENIHDARNFHRRSLQENLLDIYKELTSGNIPVVRHRGELQLA